MIEKDSNQIKCLSKLRPEKMKNTKNEMKQHNKSVFFFYKDDITKQHEIEGADCNFCGICQFFSVGILSEEQTTSKILRNF